MSPRRRKPSQNRRRRQNKPAPAELWRPIPPLDAPDPIAPADDPTTLLRSLGDMPLQGQGAVAQHYVAAVVERAAAVATALAATADLLAGEADGGDEAADGQ